MNAASVEKRLYGGCVEEVSSAVDCVRNDRVLRQEEMFDSACGSGTHNLVQIRRSVACSDVFVELLQGMTRRPGSYRPNQLKRLPIHLVLVKTSG
jgi:hypothetical protein